MMDDVASRRPIRVVVADDHAFFRDGIVSLLSAAGVNVAADVPNGAAMIDVVRSDPPDVAVVDLTMPGISGVEVSQTLGRVSPDTPVLILTVSRDEEDILRALIAGARAYVLKDGPIEELVTALGVLAEGGSYISAKVRDHLSRRLVDMSSTKVSRFTPRQDAILAGVVEGLATRQLAERLGIGMREVQEALAAVVTRLQVESRGDIAVNAMRHRIV